MTVIELINWLRQFQENRRIINSKENREMEYTDIGLNASENIKDKELFD